MKYMDLIKSLEDLIFSRASYNRSQQNIIDLDIEAKIDSILNAIMSQTDNKVITSAIHKLEICLDSNSTLRIPFLLLSFEKNSDSILDVNINKDEYKLSVDSADAKSYNDEFFRLLSLFPAEIRISHQWEVGLLHDDDFYKGFFDFLIEFFQSNLDEFIKTEENIRLQVKIIFIIRKLSKHFNKPELFYLASLSYIDYLNQILEFQYCRDFCEEILLMSCEDKIKQFGFFAMFKAYSMQNNIVVSLIWGNLFSKLIKSLNVCSESLFKKYLFQVHKLFRNMTFQEEENKYFKFITNEVTLSEYEKQDLSFSHFNLLLRIKDSKIIKEVYSFLLVNIENILSEHAKATAIRWLNLLYNIKSVFEKMDTSVFDNYIKIFESACDKELIKKFKAYAFGEGDIKGIFIDEFVNINKTRFKEDIIYDIYRPAVLSNKLIKRSLQNNDPEGLMLSSIVQSDISFNYIEKEILHPERLRIINDEEENVSLGNMKSKLQNYLSIFLENIKLSDTDILIFLLEAKDKIHFLSYSNECKFSKIEILEDWNIEEMNKFLNEKDNLEFDDNEFIDDQNIALLNIKNKLKIFNVDSNNKNVLLIKDITLSRFPNNLLLNNKDSFISINNQITQIFSVDWYIESLNENKVISDRIPKLWIPLGTDMTLNLLYSKLEESVKKYEIIVDTNNPPSEVFNKDINIIIAHGPQDISSNNIFYSNRTPIVDIENIIGTGKLGILFVCFSGSMKQEIFSYSVATLVKKFIDRGYSAIIAPFWSLHISIPPIWLPIFLECLKNGLSVSEATLIANQEVNKKHPHPGAWACLHLYGDPNLRIKCE